MVGEFKDDQLQYHTHSLSSYQEGSAYNVGLNPSNYTTFNQGTGGIRDARNGDVTRGKRKGIKYIIKVL